VQRVSASVQFDEGWRLLRAGQTAEAAVKFAEIEEHADAAELVEDAMFWRAVALGRSGRAADARSVLDAFLVRFPTSGRRGEAAVMLGWNLLQVGDRAAARRLFESSANDPVDRVRKGARAGLARARAD
jgi:outer membrane protein assembly factor BamD (BamD/ComL family)